ncbi:hypothetical protein [Streptomyces sp. GbtcB6]|uniref:hypothetical protein n=1 Tax=Streptomyces sp. GbtcB6 TaxID=2824751 RepID=UPI001C309CB6|nr:hypothetical protein [Streptomyces sp. GbtcB6]
MRTALSGAGGLGGVLVSHLAGAPWWAIIGCIVLLLVVVGVQSVFPQDSADRLAWWKDRRRYQARRDRPPAALPPQTTRESAPPAADPGRARGRR